MITGKSFATNCYQIPTLIEVFALYIISAEVSLVGFCQAQARKNCIRFQKSVENFMASRGCWMKTIFPWLEELAYGKYFKVDFFHRALSPPPLRMPVFTLPSQYFGSITAEWRTGWVTT